MKKVAVLIILIGFNITACAQNCDKLLGNWLSANKQGHIQIYKKGGKYFGKINWINKPNDANGKPQTDKRNIHPELRSRRLLNLEILKDLNCDGVIYKEGNIYDPERGRTFSCELVLNGNILVVMGYLGMFIAHTEKWTRIR